MLPLLMNDQIHIILVKKLHKQNILTFTCIQKTIIRFVNRKYCKKALLNRKQLERIDLKKHHLVSGTRIFINENLTLKNEHLAFSYRQLKKNELYIRHIYEE